MANKSLKGGEYERTFCKERWKWIDGWEGFYKISDHGRVKSFARIVIRKDGNALSVPERILTPVPSGGYLAVFLCYAGQMETRFIHRLVLEAFVGSCPPGMESLHKDGDGENNYWKNLRWGTHDENMKDKVRHGRSRKGVSQNRGASCGTSKLTAPKVRKIRKLHSSGKYTLAAVGAKFGVSPENVCAIIKGRSWSWLK